MTVASLTVPSGRSTWPSSKDATGYVWVERQDPTAQFAWVALQPANRMIAAAARNQVTGSTQP
ncbi:MAG: hypothetical protein WDN08_06220 [Rhizomicrobium sp.]